ncbi:MAG TPA: hypothetical protein PLF13_10250 [candidate division Zixibacteria bacterium]|nr:hypothetical protein [candidate division Zixibacteria bacterium]
MDYGNIVKESFKIAWEHKSLWVFGFFASGGIGFNFDPSTFGGSRSELPWGTPNGLENIFDSHWLLPFIGLIAIIILVFLIVNLICTPALIDAVNRIRRGGTYTFKSSFSAGVDFLGRFLLFFLILLACSIVFFGVLVGIGALAFCIHVAVGVVSLLILIPVFILGISLCYVLTALTERAMVLRNIGIAKAFDEAVLLIRREPGKNAIMLLINIAISIGLSMGSMILFLMIGLPLAALGVLSGLSLIPAIVLTMIIGFPISLVIGGFVGTGIFNMYTLFYIELVEPTQPTAASIPPGL